MSRRHADQGSWKSPSAMRSSQKEVVVETVRYRVVTSWGSFVLLNIFRVVSRVTRSRYLVYRSKNHKYDFMHKRTSLELGSELRYILGRC